MPRVQRLTVSTLAQPPGYAHVVVATGTRLVTTTGAVPLDEEGNVVGSGDVRAQARQTLHNLMRQLRAAAASTLLVVSLLGYTGQLVEIEALAVLP